MSRCATDGWPVRRRRLVPAGFTAPAQCHARGVADTVLNTARLSGDELVRLGHERDLKRLLEPEHEGKWVVIPVVNGDYEVGPDKHRSLDDMKRKYPDDVFFFARVGDAAAINL